MYIHTHTPHLESIIETGAACQLCPIPLLLSGNARGAGQTGRVKFEVGALAGAAGPASGGKLSNKVSKMIRPAQPAILICLCITTFQLSPVNLEGLMSRFAKMRYFSQRLLPPKYRDEWYFVNKVEKNKDISTVQNWYLYRNIVPITNEQMMLSESNRGGKSPQNLYFK